MILHPWIFSLLVGQSAVFILFTISAINGWQIYRYWDYASGDEIQYRLEKKTSLVSITMNFALVVQIFILFLFVLAADELARLLPGAMCAAGSLDSNDYGFPLLCCMILSGFLSFQWLVINYLDNQIETCPLVRLKNLFVVLLYPLAVIELVLFFAFIIHIDPSVITSCCGSIFTKGVNRWGGEMSTAPIEIVLPLFFVIVSYLLIGYFLSFQNVKKANLLNDIIELVMWAGFFLLSFPVIISFLSTYIYRMVSHKCPFCFISAEHYYIGIPIYAGLFGATAAGLASGMIGLLKKSEVPDRLIITIQNKLSRIAVFGMILFVVTGFMPFVIYYVKTGHFI